MAKANDVVMALKGTLSAATAVLLLEIVPSQAMDQGARNDEERGGGVAPSAGAPAQESSPSGSAADLAKQYLKATTVG